MDCKDLMIGDWVYDTMRQENKKVTPMDFERNPMNGVYYAETLLPIPLTSDILVKNGFDNQMPYNDYAFGEISLYEGGNGYIVNGFVGLGGLNVHIDYVHQLQHLLRLCGIEKELVID